MNKAAVKPTSAYRVLVVDDQQQMRQIIRESVYRLGMHEVMMAGSAAEALKLMRAGTVDLVLSDYNLGEGPDGQQLLEAARSAKLLSPVAPWIYITANALRTDILAAGDFMPDGYIVKPFTDQLLARYIEALSARKQMLAPLLLAVEAQQWEQVLEIAEGFIQRGDALSVEGLKQKAQALMRLARFEDARLCYAQTLQLNSELAWAQLGQAQALRAQGKTEQARAALEQLTRDQPAYASAYDVMLEMAEDQGDQQAALGIAQTVADLVPNAKRKLRLGSLALGAGETELALRALEQAVAKNKHAVQATPQGSLLLAQALLDKGDAMRALSITGELSKRFAQQPEAQLLGKALSAQAQQRLGNTAAATALMLEVEQAMPGAVLDERDKLMVAKSALNTGLTALGQGLITEVARNNSDRPLLLATALRSAAGTAAEADCRALIEQAGREASQTMGELQQAKRSGDVAAALEVGERALALSPQNFNVLIELCSLHLIAMGRQAADEHRREQHRARAAELLARLELSHPNHDRVCSARKFYRERAGSGGS
jgi:DNA-binding NarL/FixJ family response regulator